MYGRFVVLLGAALVALIACGSDRTTTTEADIPCDQVTWGFDSVKADGSPWISVPSIRVGDRVRLTVSGFWRPPEGRPVTGACGDQVAGVAWQSSNPTIASVAPVSEKSGMVTGISPGTVDVTARFVIDNAVPKTTYLRITVLP